MHSTPKEPEDLGEVRATDFATELTAGESHAVSAEFTPDTGVRLKKAALIFAGVLGALFVLVGIDRLIKAHGVAREAAEAAGAPPLVDVVTAQPVGAVQRLVLPGETAAWHASTIYARVNGYVARWFVDIGDHVRSGQVLALIETPELDAELAAARAQLQAAQAQVLVRQAEAQLGLTTYERWRDSPKGVVSEQEREEKKADYDSALARLKSAQADVALDAAHVNQYEALAAFKKVTAPYDGVITTRDIDIGNLVTAGSTSATTPLYVMTQNDPIRIFVDAPQSAADDLLNNGAPVEVRTAGGESRQYAGKVTRTSEAINPQARTLRVEVDIPNPKAEFVPGMYVKVGFGLPPRGLVQVPAAALLFRASGPEVARVDERGQVNFRPVVIGRDDGRVVELSSGVAAGDRLALNISSQIGEGQLVHARSADSQPATAGLGR
ncbi:MAG TPA: efflux RND transporter periplasmic adaptor subunit [Steroidobacteraceae bacterium]|nr:efflux RND transporter periplasmic adaptor subunit [Steroidobacteraceae bacterium]